MISEILAVSLGLGVFGFLVTAALSPLETLSWWAGWTEQEIRDQEPAAKTVQNDSAPVYVVYLSGVASISGKYLLRREQAFIQRLSRLCPEMVIIENVFPYSPAGLPLLAAPRLFDRLWRWVQNHDLQGRRTILRGLINIRNIYQVMVSADHRYGPIFSQGAATSIASALLSAGYQPNSGAAVAIIGYSGGAQVAVGAAPFLKAQLGSPVHIISVGGVVASDPGLAVIDKLHHLHGERDRIEKLGAVIFAQRWAAFANSHWNVAKREGRIVCSQIKNIAHAGPTGYFGLPKRNGVSNYERTADMIAKTLSKLGTQ